MPALSLSNGWAAQRARAFAPSSAEAGSCCGKAHGRHGGRPSIGKHLRLSGILEGRAPSRPSIRPFRNRNKLRSAGKVTAGKTGAPLHLLQGRKQFRPAIVTVMRKTQQGRGKRLRGRGGSGRYRAASQAAAPAPSAGASRSREGTMWFARMVPSSSRRRLRAASSRRLETRRRLARKGRAASR